MKKPRQNQPPSAKKQVQVDSSNKQKLFGWAALLLGKGDHHQHPSLTQLSKEVAGVLLKEDEERGSLILNHHGQLRPISRGSLFLALAGPQVDAGYSPLKLWPGQTRHSLQQAPGRAGGAGKAPWGRAAGCGFSRGHSIRGVRRRASIARQAGGREQQHGGGDKHPRGGGQQQEGGDGQPWKRCQQQQCEGGRGRRGRGGKRGSRIEEEGKGEGGGGEEGKGEGEGGEEGEGEEGSRAGTRGEEGEGEKEHEQGWGGGGKSLPPPNSQRWGCRGGFPSPHLSNTKERQDSSTINPPSHNPGEEHQTLEWILTEETSL